MLMETRLLQSLKALLPIDVTLKGTVTVRRLVHPKNAPARMLTTPSGMVAEVNSLFLLKEICPISKTSLPNVAFPPTTRFLPNDIVLKSPAHSGSLTPP
eukprot:m.108058 g.108058  ORF g.108058 m.108058 type:complete len:99 (+) comp12789_c0_seq2:3704-4000(+)